MSRFATDPHWLIYLPPTMSPCETSSREEYLEYPTEALAYFRKNGVERVICEEKHMGSRAAVLVCRDAESARRRFGTIDGRSGVCYTRTGRPFFTEPEKEAEFITRVQAALTRSGFFDEFHTDWFCRLRADAVVGEGAGTAPEAVCSRGRRRRRGIGGRHRSSDAVPPAASGMAETYRHRLERLRKYREAYRRYCWPVNSLADYRLAPFHLLASEGTVHSEKTNRWHMETLHRLAAADPGFIVATPFLEIDLASEAGFGQACEWWEALHRPRRRRHGREAAGFCGAWA